MSTSGRCVVAISRQVGAGGAYVGQGLARALGVRYVDREILKEAASLLGRDTTEIASLEERVSSVWSRMAGALAWGGPEATYMPPPMPALYEEDLFAVQARIIRQTAAQEEAVFVGRAATWVLRERKDLLSVFLHAPEAVRVERVMQEYHLTDREEARKMVARFRPAAQPVSAVGDGRVVVRRDALPSVRGHGRHRSGRHREDAGRTGGGAARIAGLVLFEFTHDIESFCPAVAAASAAAGRASLRSLSSRPSGRRGPRGGAARAVV